MSPASASGASSSVEADDIVRQLLLSPEGRKDPYPLYTRLRALAPIHHSQMGMWILSAHKDCAQVLEDGRLGKDYVRHNESRIGPHWRNHISLTESERSLVNLDGPEHTRLRRLVAKAFTRSRIEALRPNIERQAGALIARLEAEGGGDLLHAFGFPLAMGVIGEMLGVPAEDLGRFPRLLRDLLVVFETRPSLEELTRADAAQEQLRNYFADLIREKRQRPKHDLLSALIVMEEDGDRLQDDELWTLATLLFGAGFETTANQIGNGVTALLEHPAEMQRLRAEPALFRRLPDELLRYDGVAQMTVRVPHAAVEVRDVVIPAGDTILVLLGAGNRDPERYPDPDRLSVERDNVRPLTFGGGVHFCLGAALARVELEIAFRMLLDRFETIEAVSPPVFRDRLTLRGPEALPVRCRPNSGGSS